MVKEIAPLKTCPISMSLTVRVLGVNGCTSALQAEGNRFDTDKIHLKKLIGRGNVQKDVSVGVTTG